MNCLEADNSYIKIACQGEVVKHHQYFLKNNYFKLIGNNWHEPVEDPKIAMFTQTGNLQPHKNTFGMGRGRLHSGLDIFSLEGSPVYSCLDAIVVETYKYGGYGYTITLQVERPQELRNRRREYTPPYATDKKKENLFNEDDEKLYLFYAHLEDILVKEGNKIKAGTIIGKSGISGIASGTKDPHLHFNIYSTKKRVIHAKKYLVNPAYFVYWKETGDLTEEDKKVQIDRKNKGQLKNVNPKLSEL